MNYNSLSIYLKDLSMKLNKNYIIIGFFILIIGGFILFTQDRKTNKSEITNDIVYKNKEDTNISIKRLDNNLFEITYKVSSFLDNTNVDEKIVVNYDNLNKVKLEDGDNYSFFSCSISSKEKKKYFILLDISYSVVNKVGKDKFISDIDAKLRKILEKTKLNPGDEIEIRYFGDNKSKDLVFDFIGPVFEGAEKKNNVYKKNTLEISGYGFANAYSCSGKKSLTDTQELLKIINSGYTEKIKIPAGDTKISSTFKSIDSDLNKVNNTQEYKKIIYIMFTDADDTENYKNCFIDNCGYKNINYSGNDEAYIIWSNDFNEYNLKQLFKGINLVIY